jgi:hypothetical protein
MPLRTPTPQYTHDCDDCIFIGQHGKTDVYVCSGDSGREDSLIARSGNDDPEYSSFPISVARSIADSSMDWDLRVRLYDAFIAGRNSL